MTSIHTNAGAISALQTLRFIGSDLDRTQNEVSSGLRIATASDNAAYWSISTTMRSDNKALSAVQDAMGLGAAQVDVTYAAIDSVVDLMSEFKAKLVTAREPAADKLKINDELSQLKQQMRSIAESASFSGENWLVFTEADLDYWNYPREITVGFTRNEGDVSVQTLQVGPALNTISTTSDLQFLLDDTLGGNTGEAGILSSDQFALSLGTADPWVLVHTSGAAYNTMGTEMALAAGTTASQIDDMIGVVDAMQKQVISVASELGSIQKRIGMQQDFVSKLTDSIDSGIGRLVDADMNEASTRLKALQTQEQLAIQSLQIANTNGEHILTLFR